MAKSPPPISANSESKILLPASVEESTTSSEDVAFVNLSTDTTTNWWLFLLGRTH